MSYKEISFDFSDDSAIDEGRILADYIKRQKKDSDDNYLGIASETDKEALTHIVIQDLLIISGELLPLYYFVFDHLSKT